MTRLFAEAWFALDGMWRLLTFKPDWEWEFDVSMRGIWRSFLAVVIALPLVVIAILSLWHQNGSVQVTPYLLSFAASWVVFPLTAALAVRVLNVPGRFAHWVVLHNWGVIYLYAIIAFMALLRVAGIANAEVAGFLVYLYLPVRILVHWRIAYMALGVPTITAAAAATVPILATSLTYELIYRAFSSGG